MGKECPGSNAVSEQKRISVICEGQSENAFVKRILSPYIGEKTDYSILLLPCTLITSKDKKAGRQYRGGLVSYEKALNDIRRCLGSDDIVTTMFDLYALPKDFPGAGETSVIASGIDMVKKIETELQADVVKRSGIREVL